MFLPKNKLGEVRVSVKTFDDLKFFEICQYVQKLTFNQNCPDATSPDGPRFHYDRLLRTDETLVSLYTFLNKKM